MWAADATQTLQNISTGGWSNNKNNINQVLLLHVLALRGHKVHMFVYLERENFYNSLILSQLQLLKLKILKLMRGKTQKKAESRKHDSG